MISRSATESRRESSAEAPLTTTTRSASGCSARASEYAETNGNGCRRPVTFGGRAEKSTFGSKENPYTIGTPGKRPLSCSVANRSAFAPSATMASALKS